MQHYFFSLSLSPVLYILHNYINYLIYIRRREEEKKRIKWAKEFSYRNFCESAPGSNAAALPSNKVTSPDPFIMIVSARFVHYWGHQYPSYSSEAVFLFCALINFVFPAITDHLLVSGIVYHPVLLIRHFSECALVKYSFSITKKLLLFISYGSPNITGEALGILLRFLLI